MKVRGLGGRPPALEESFGGCVANLFPVWSVVYKCVVLSERGQTHFGVIVTTVCIFPTTQERCLLV